MAVKTSFGSYAKSRGGKAGRSSTSITMPELAGRRGEKKAKSGEGQVVLLSGEPGIGKSRLTAALMERLAKEPHTRLRYFCSPQQLLLTPGA